MTNPEPIIGNYITPCSVSISPKASARNAFWLMRKNGIQYLPVKVGHDIVGLLPNRLVRAALSGNGQGIPKISDLMIRKPSVTSPETSLYNVLDETPENAGGCTIIQRNSGEIVGVFTPNDAVFAFRSLTSQASA